jgi:hypothetical protein
MAARSWDSISSATASYAQVGSTRSSCDKKNCRRQANETKDACIIHSFKNCDVFGIFSMLLALTFVDLDFE